MEIDTSTLTKECPRCLRELPLEKFGRSKKSKDGLRPSCRDCGSVLLKKRMEDYKTEIYNKLGHVCCRCGFADKRALQIDHVFGGGNKEHSEISSAGAYLKKVIADTDGLYQILCANCNWIKRMEKLEHSKPKPFTPEELEKILESRIGKPILESTREKIRANGIERGAFTTGLPAWNRGIERPPELKEKLSVMATERHAKMTVEERSAVAQKRDAAMTPEERSARAQKGADTLRGRRESEGWVPKPKVIKQTKKNKQGEEVPFDWTIEERIAFSDVAKSRHAARTPEQKAATKAKTQTTWDKKKAELVLSA